MYAQSIIKNLFSIINIFLITYLLIDRKNNQEYRKKNWYSYVLCIGSIFLVRVMENGVSIHIVYNYITIVIIVMFIGHFLFQRNMKYCILIGSIFLSISLLGQLLSSIFLYPYSGNRVLAELPGIYQVVMMVIAESVIIAGCLTLKKIIERIPPHLSSINVMTIFIPLLLNIIVMAVCTDNLFFEHIFYKAMVQILEYYLQQPIEIVREKLGVYIDYIQEEDLKFSEFGEKIAKRLSDER